MKFYSVKFVSAYGFSTYLVADPKRGDNRVSAPTVNRRGEPTGKILIGDPEDFQDWQEMELSLTYGWLILKEAV